MAPIDAVVLTILGIAALRGLLLGLIREAFSIAALAAACVSVRVFGDQAALWVESVTNGQVGPLAAPWVAGALLATATIAVVVVAGRIIKRGARLAGLGWADRAGGAVLGAAEGALVVGVLLVLGSAVFGRDHPALAQTRSLAALEQLEGIAAERQIDVASPPPPSR